MLTEGVFSQSKAASDNPHRQVLNVGSGPAQGNLHVGFRESWWKEIRLDIDAAVRPDIVGSLSELQRFVAEGTFDAIWSSHSLEHLHTHEIVPALRGFRRALKANGFALVTCPDLTAVAKFMLQENVEAIAYQAAVGPIRALDMIYGHARSISEGKTYMAHNTGFTVERLGRVALDAGFPEVRVMAGQAFDLWGAFLMPDANLESLRSQFRNTSVEQLFTEPRSKHI